MSDQIQLLGGILFPAFVAGLLVLSTHVPLGREVLMRGIIFLDLAIAQVAALGVLLADAMGFHAEDDSSGFITQVVAMFAAVVGASFLYLFRKAEAKTQEALIGIVFMLSATGTILLLASDPHGGERLQALLAGQILWVDADKLIFAGAISVLLLALWFGIPSLQRGYGFYPLFAVAITVSTQLVGVYLVFASLIVPALACQQARHPLRIAFVLGMVSYALGLALSAVHDLPSGALITWMMVMVAMVYHAVNNRRRWFKGVP